MGIIKGVKDVHLEPCPFCGAESRIGKVTYPEDSEVAKLNERHIGYFVNCLLCGARYGNGLCYATEEDAAKLWNQRFAPDAPEGDIGSDH